MALKPRHVKKRGVRHPKVPMPPKQRKKPRPVCHGSQRRWRDLKASRVTSTTTTSTSTTSTTTTTA